MNIISEVEFTERVKKALRKIDSETLAEKIENGSVKLEELGEPIKEYDGIVLHRFVSMQVLAKMTGLTPKTIYRKRKEKSASYYKEGKEVMIKVYDLIN